MTEDRTELNGVDKHQDLTNDNIPREEEGGGGREEEEGGGGGRGGSGGEGGGAGRKKKERKKKKWPYISQIGLLRRFRQRRGAQAHMVFSARGSKMRSYAT